MRVKVTLPTRSQLNTTIESQQNLLQANLIVMKNKDAEIKKLKEDLHRQRYESLTRLIDSIATINRSLASVAGEAGAFITK